MQVGDIVKYARPPLGVGDPGDMFSGIGVIIERPEGQVIRPDVLLVWWEDDTIVREYEDELEVVSED